MLTIGELLLCINTVEFASLMLFNKEQGQFDLLMWLSKEDNPMKRFSKFDRAVLSILFIGACVMTYQAIDAHDTTTRWSEGVSLVPEIVDVMSGYPRASIVRYDPIARYLVIQIESPLTGPSDGMCQYTSEMFHKLCSISSDLRLEVLGEFVPSAVNPMTLAWTKELVAGGQY